MPPSPTVENYLKAILQAQIPLTPADLVPMGDLASSLGVTPGTTTTMVKSLAEAGLVRYEPYVGVRLNPSGEKLAVRVLRRHRLVELFLVRIMGLSWTEVHEEAERLEHAVSEALIDRMDEMLGRPEVDPHGDPIPGREGQLELHEYQNLLSCPLHRPVVVKRIIDQSPAFLRFIEASELKPGERLQVETRDAASDTIIVDKAGRRVTFGMDAAAKLLVAMVVALSFLVISVGPVTAQTSAAVPFPILDNSFIVEEAFNQPTGVFQNIFGLILDEGTEGAEWVFGFTQEWPVGSQLHQISYTVPVTGLSGNAGIGDVLINYRYQWWVEGAGRPAFSPRISVILPSGNEDAGRSAGVVGWQANLPFSKQQGDLYFHWNGGFTWLPNVTDSIDLFTPFLAASAIWRTRPMFHLMLEALALFDEELDTTAATVRKSSLTLSPGFRTGWNVSDHQLILGFAVPLTLAEEANNAAAFVYFSYELPFKR